MMWISRSTIAKRVESWWLWRPLEYRTCRHVPESRLRWSELWCIILHEVAVRRWLLLKGGTWSAGRLQETPEPLMHSRVDPRFCVAHANFWPSEPSERHCINWDASLSSPIRSWPRLQGLNRSHVIGRIEWTVSVRWNVSLGIKPTVCVFYITFEWRTAPICAIWNTL